MSKVLKFFYLVIFFPFSCSSPGGNDAFEGLWVNSEGEFVEISRNGENFLIKGHDNNQTLGGVTLLGKPFESDLKISNPIFGGETQIALSENKNQIYGFPMMELKRLDLNRSEKDFLGYWLNYCTQKERKSEVARLVNIEKEGEQLTINLNAIRCLGTNPWPFPPIRPFQKTYRGFFENGMIKVDNGTELYFLSGDDKMYWVTNPYVFDGTESLQH